MAKKSNGKGAVSVSLKTTKPVAEKETQQLTVVPAYPASFPSFYSNYVSVSHTGSEIFVDCCLMGMPYNVNLDEAQVTVPVIARVILPPKVAVALIEVLRVQTDKQKDTEKKGSIAVASLPKPKSKRET